MTERASSPSQLEPIEYENLVHMFNRALIHTLRKHAVTDSFLELWVPDADPVRGIVSMVDSARLTGLSAISIRFQIATVPIERLSELEQDAAALGTTTLNVNSNAVLLTVTEMKRSTSSETRSSSSPAALYRKTYPGLNVLKAEPEMLQQWSNSELPGFADVHPHFRAGLQTALRELACEGVDTSPVDGLIRLIGQEGSTVLAFDVDPKTHVIRAARHVGAKSPSERALLDLFCKEALNLPIQEAADHTILKVLQKIRDTDNGPSVPGVLLPVNAGAPFMLGVRLARRAYDDYRAQMRLTDATNFYYQPPSAAWQRMSHDDKLVKVDYVRRAFLQSEDLDPDDIRILRIEKNKYGYLVRVIIGFSDRLAPSRKPQLMRRLEQRLQRHVEAEIDLVAERVKDTSPLRRLT